MSSKRQKECQGKAPLDKEAKRNGLSKTSALVKGYIAMKNNAPLLSGERDQLLKDIRLKLPLNPQDDPLRDFQDQALRPILKFQNRHILDLYKSYLDRNRANWEQMGEHKQKEYIQQSLQKVPELKFILIGSIIGYFSQEELAFYQKYRREIHKRLTSFLAKRIYDGLSQEILK